MTFPEAASPISAEQERISKLLEELRSRLDFVWRGDNRFHTNYECAARIGRGVLQGGRMIVSASRAWPLTDGSVQYVDVLLNAGTESATPVEYETVVVDGNGEVPFGEILSDDAATAQSLQEAYKQGDVEFVIQDGVVIEQNHLSAPV